MTRKFRPNGIEFETDIPDDCLWDEDGEQVVRSGGMALSQAIASLLERDGMQVSVPDADEEHERWDFTADWRGARFRVEVVQMDFCMVVVDGGPWLLTRLLFRSLPTREGLTEHIAALMGRDRRFGEIKLVKAY